MDERINYNTLRHTTPAKRTKYIRRVQNGILSSIVDEEVRKKRLKEKGGSDIGLRGMFFKMIETENIEIDEAIKRFIEEHSAFEEKDIINWIREALKTKKISENVLEKLEKYSRKKEEEIRESDDDAR